MSMNNYINDESIHKMVLSLDAYGKKTIIELPDDAGIEDFVNALYTLGISATYHHYTMINGFRNFTEENDFDRPESLPEDYSE